MLECQSRQVPIKSKRTALIWFLGLVSCVDIIGCVNVIIGRFGARIVYRLKGTMRYLSFFFQSKA